MPVSLLHPVRAFPVLTRAGLSWRSVAPDRVEIAVVVSNDGPGPSEAGDLVIEAAALGAFVPSRPVARIALGSLDPGERRRVATIVPRRILDRAGAFAPMNVGAVLLRAFGGTGIDARALDWMSQAQWIGNLNVWFDRRPERAVERHCAFGLRIAAGRAVAAMVDLPTSARDYRIETSCSDPRWSAELLPMIDRITLLLVRPPAEPGLRADVTVSVTRLSDARRVPVEFAFETTGGPGDTLGCVGV